MAIGSGMADPYETLGVPRDASAATIRSSYKKLMLQCHPDKVHDESQRAAKAAQFTKVQEAYELLSDSRKRKKYDDEVARGGQPGAAAARASGSGSASPDKRETDRSARHERRQKRTERTERERREWDGEPRAGADRFASSSEGKAARDERFQQAQQQGRQQGQEEGKRRAYSSRHAEDTPPRTRSHETRHESRHPAQEPNSRHPAPEPSSRHPPPEPSNRHPAPEPSRRPAPPRHQPPPHVPPPHVPPQCPTPPARDGYKASVAEEEEKKRRVRAAMGLPPESSTHVPPHVPPASPYMGGSPAAAYTSTHSSSPYTAPGAGSTRSRSQDDPVVVRAREELKRHQERQEAERKEYHEKRERAHRLKEQEKNEEREQKKAREKLNRSSDSSSMLGVGADAPTSSSRRRPSHSTSSRGAGEDPASSHRGGLGNLFFGSSAPSSFPFNTMPNAAYSPHINNLRRRASISESPNPEKQFERQKTAEMRRQMRREEPEAPYDSGYSSPSPDTSSTPVKEASKTKTCSSPDAAVLPDRLGNAGASVERHTADVPVNPANPAGPWKRYTFDVFVREDDTASTIPATPQQHPASTRRKPSTSCAGSPPQHRATPTSDPTQTAGPALPPDFAPHIVQATGIIGDKEHYFTPPQSSLGGVPLPPHYPPNTPNSYIHPPSSGYPSVPLSTSHYTHTNSRSHSSHSSHGSPRPRAARPRAPQHTSSSPHSSPKVGGEHFGAGPGLTRSSTLGPLGGSAYHHHASSGATGGHRRASAMPGSYEGSHTYGAVPGLSRGSTWHASH